MSLKSQPGYIYGACEHINRVAPDFEVNEHIAREIGNNYRTLPTFEQSLYNHVLTRHYSLERNEFLHCRWQEYKKHVEGRRFAPFQFPDIRDLHFFNNAIRFLPSESIHHLTTMERRKRLKPGPGVDFGSFGGQMPIPQELMMKRGTIEQEEGKELKHHKIYKRVKKEKHIEAKSHKV